MGCGCVRFLFMVSTFGHSELFQTSSCWIVLDELSVAPVERQVESRIAADENQFAPSCPRVRSFSHYVRIRNSDTIGAAEIGDDEAREFDLLDDAAPNVVDHNDPIHPASL